MVGGRADRPGDSRYGGGSVPVPERDSSGTIHQVALGRRDRHGRSTTRTVCALRRGRGRRSPGSPVASWPCTRGRPRCVTPAASGRTRTASPSRRTCGCSASGWVSCSAGCPVPAAADYLASIGPSSETPSAIARARRRSRCRRTPRAGHERLIETSAVVLPGDGRGEFGQLRLGELGEQWRRRASPMWAGVRVMASANSSTSFSVSSNSLLSRNVGRARNCASLTPRARLNADPMSRQYSQLVSAAALISPSALRRGGSTLRSSRARTRGTRRRRVAAVGAATSATGLPGYGGRWERRDETSPSDRGRSCCRSAPIAGTGTPVATIRQSWCVGVGSVLRSERRPTAPHPRSPA